MPLPNLPAAAQSPDCDRRANFAADGRAPLGADVWRLAPHPLLIYYNERACYTTQVSCFKMKHIRGVAGAFRPYWIAAYGSRAAPVDTPQPA